MKILHNHLSTLGFRCKMDTIPGTDYGTNVSTCLRLLLSFARCEMIDGRQVHTPSPVQIFIASFSKCIQCSANVVEMSA